MVYFSFTLLWYTTSEMPAVMTSVTQKAFQMPSAPSRQQNSQRHDDNDVTAQRDDQ